jgi:hypothetical protein
MSVEELLCTAIRERKIVRFWYNDKAPSYRVAEPHMVAYNSKEKLILSAWVLAGESVSDKGRNWREYFISEIDQLRLLDGFFDGPRPGYKPDGGKKFHNVRCGL